MTLGGAQTSRRGDLEFALTAGCDMLDANYEITVIDHATGRKSNTVVATVVSNPACGAHLPDLAVDRIALGAVDVRAGESLDVELVIRNDGGSASARSQTRLCLGEVVETNTWAPALADSVTPPIRPGESLRLAERVRVPDAMPAGRYAVWAVLDNNDELLEWRTKNNFVSSVIVRVLDPPRIRQVRSVCP